MKLLSTLLLAFSLLGNLARGLDLQVEDDDSVKKTSATIADGLVKYYTGWKPGDTPGNLPDPYYWWEAGAMFGTLIDYWFITGDSQYNKIITQAMVHQSGDKNDFMPNNQTTTEGNDDQGFWAMAAMSAAENAFPNPPADQPQWLPLVQAVFNEYVSRWETAICGGGMRWQIFTFNSGFDYKNTISNGCFFNIAARLARYTDNSTYADWADKIFDWTEKVGIMTETYRVLDGVKVTKDDKCGAHDLVQWTYNAGIFLHGAANMYNITKNDKWKARVDGILKQSTIDFLKDGIPFEVACEPRRACNFDQQTFKGYFVRWLSGTVQLASHTTDIIMPILKKTATAAAATCNGSPATGYNGKPGTACGFTWLNNGAFDGIVGVGEQMSALSAVMYPLASRLNKAIATGKKGGLSKGDPKAGNEDSNKLPEPRAITGADRAGAGLLTTLMIIGLVGGVAFVVT